MAHPEIKRNQTQPNRGLRSHELRKTAQVEGRAQDNRADVWASGNANLTAEGGSDWGDAIYVAGHDRLHLFLDFTFGDGGNDITQTFVAVQASPTKGGTDWYDVYEDLGTGTLTPEILGIFTAADAKIMWGELRTKGYYMRFKLYVDGATFTDSRATLSAIRIQDSM